MKLVVGLGNPGNNYNFTRHNVGFLTLDFYAKIKGFSWEKTEKNSAIYFREGDTFFIKPQTFYNDAGISIAAFARFYKIKNKDILVICDDFNLDFGKIRYREKGTAGGNNGLKSAIEKLGTDEFTRLRIGTANDAMRRKIGDTDFVLGKFSPEEKEKLPVVLREAAARIDEYLS